MPGSMILKPMILRPWAGARAAGRTGLAMVLFFMQVSLVFWPAAVRAAHRLEVQRQRQALLDQLSVVYAPVLTEKQVQSGFTVFESVP